MAQNNAFLLTGLSFPIALQINRKIYYNLNENKYSDKINIKENHSDLRTSLDEYLSEDEEEED